jgi:hypothetical protein
MSASWRCWHFLSCSIHLSGAYCGIADDVCVGCSGLCEESNGKLLFRLHASDIRFRQTHTFQRQRLHSVVAYGVLSSGTVEKMRLAVHALFFVLWIIIPSWALHQSEVGVVDWHKNLIGIPLHGSRSTAPVFHRVGGDNTQSVVLTATESNVLAALNPVNGSVGRNAAHFSRNRAAAHGCISLEIHIRGTGSYRAVL